MSSQLYSKRDKSLLRVSLIAVVSTIAFENLATTADLAAIGKHFHTTTLLPLILSLYLGGEVLGIVALGEASRRFGQKKAALSGILLFQIGIVLVAISPSITMLLLARIVQSIGGGTFGSIGYVIIKDVFDEKERPKIFFGFSLAWVLPSLFAPALSGLLAQSLGWQAPFLVVLPISIISTILTANTLKSQPYVTPTRLEVQSSTKRILAALLLSVGLSLALRLSNGNVTAISYALAVPLLILAGVGGYGLIPFEAIRVARQLKWLIIFRFVTDIAFFGVDGLLPLLLFQDRHLSLTAAGATLTTAAISWSIGSWVNSKFTRKSRRSLILWVGSLVALVGVIGTAASILFNLSTLLVVSSWTITGLGMGGVYVTISVATLDFVPDEETEVATSAIALADTTGIAVGTGVVGTFVSVASTMHAAHVVSAGVLIGTFMSAAIFILTIATSGKIRAHIKSAIA